MLLMSALTHALVRPRRVALCGFALLALALGPKVADAANISVLGSSSQTAFPACPASPCQAIGKVTGFQTAIGNAKKPFLAPSDGKIVAWSIKLSAPNDKQKQFFDDYYGGQPSARIAVLKSLKKNPIVYKLRAQGPLEDLNPLLGSTTTFTLRTPLTVRAGQVIGLTIPTWAPAFAINLPNDVTWRSSRKPNKCQSSTDIQAGFSQQAPGTQRKYGCSYPGARLLYSATMVQGPVATAPTKPTKPTK